MKSHLRAHIHCVPPALREVSLRVAEVDGINLGQGICEMPVPEVVQQAAVEAIKKGLNRYCPAQGIAGLREAIAQKLRAFNGIKVHTDDVLITPGSTGAFEALAQAFLEAGDEVISFKPFYPYHHNTLVHSKAEIKYVSLKPPEWNFNFEELQAAFSDRTKFVLINTPNNPTGKVYSRNELLFIGECCRKAGAFIVSDEVYEYMTYDGHNHISPASLPELADITITVGSYSKTFAITGWRIGYLTAPQKVLPYLRTVSDRAFVCAPTPFQHAVATGIIGLGDEYYCKLNADLLRKREILASGLKDAGFKFIEPQGAYYIFADSSDAFPGMSSEDAVLKMIETAHVGAVPASDFLGLEVKGDPEKSRFMRFCFAVPDEKLERAGELLSNIRG
ncbi:MAG: pyridoxal phosphate-dependent aminotransferase [Candidatus Dadabacteria bacterium]|nr:MAG: pyridoxal phosphate-dependent aminotransferase [Candidatus Dadabacteria bacterium]